MKLPCSHQTSALLTALCSVIVSTPALAQLMPLEDNYTRPNSRIPREMETVGAEEVRRVVKYFGSCVYRREPEMADALLRNSDQTSIGYSRMGIAAEDLVDELDMSHCLGRAMDAFSLESQLRMSPTTLRSHLAEASYLANNDQAPDIGEDDPEVLPNRYFGPSASQHTRYRAAFSDCIAFHAPHESDRLLRTDPNSNEEAAAVQSLIPALSACLTEGRDIQLTIATIRGLVADGMWARTNLKIEARPGTNE